MGYIMKICKGENNEQSFQKPSPAAIDRAIDDLIPAIYHFVILEVEPPIEKCSYVQALIEREGKAKGRYLIETRYKFTTDTKHYRKHVADAGEVKELFRGFAQGVAPNVAGWDDITAKLTAGMC